MPNKQDAKSVRKKRAILESATRLVADIRAWSESQSELWQCIPWLALQAEGRTGWSDGRQMAYALGLWRITEVHNRFGHYTVCVDCATGRLVCVDDPSREADPEDVLRCAFHPGALDATLVVKELEEQGRVPYFKGYDISEVEARRAKLAHDHFVLEVYVRKGAMPKLSFSWD